MNKDRCRELIQLALRERAFPPRLVLPESTEDSVVTLFDCPYLVWVPESLRPNRRPACVDATCLCTPGIKEYMWRAVDDVEHVTHLLYVKYHCTAEGENRPVFSTKGGQYLAQASDSVQLQLPYFLQEKGGKSIPLFQQIHDGVMSSDGLERVRVSVERSRLSRYYKLRSLFAARVQEKQRSGKLTLAPTPVPVEKFIEHNPIPTHQALTRFWMAETTLLAILDSQVMRRLEIKQVLRLDHSRKLAKNLRKHTTATRQDQKEMHLLLLVQNEAGQVVARAFTRSENNEETQELLMNEIKDRVPAPAADDGETTPVYLVSDNANAIRGMVQSVFGHAVSVKQDPFHVFQRLAQKIKDRATRKLFSKALREALYDGEEELKAPDVAATDVAAVCAKFVPPDTARSVLNCSVSEWEGSVRSNIDQISSGDLYVPSNIYTEGAGSSKIVSTSQLESVHAQLKRLINRAVSYEVGLRILDLYLLEHNLRAGDKFWRNPKMGSLDLLSLCRAAVRCNGVLPESPQLEFALSACAATVPTLKYHYKTKHGFPFSAFASVFRPVQPDVAAMEARLHPQHEYRNDIRRYLLCQRNEKHADQLLFATSLRSFMAGTEDASPMSHHEYELLRQVRCDQRTHGNAQWAECPLTTTLLYNIAAESGQHTRFKLKKRSSETLQKHIVHIDARLKSSPEKATTPLFTFQKKTIDDSDENEHESLLQADLFALLRSMGSKRGAIDHFCRLYDFAASLLDNVRPKTEKQLRRRWEALRKVDMRSSTKLRFPLSMVQSVLGEVGTKKSYELMAVSESHNEHGGDVGVVDGAFPHAAAAFDVDSSPATTPSGSAPFDTVETAVGSATIELISKCDLDMMSEMSERMGKNVRGKWPAIARWYAGVKPGSTLSVEALHSRVKRHKRQQEESLECHGETKKHWGESTPNVDVPTSLSANKSRRVQVAKRNTGHVAPTVRIRIVPNVLSLVDHSPRLYPFLQSNEYASWRLISTSITPPHRTPTSIRCCTSYRKLILFDCECLTVPHCQIMVWSTQSNLEE